jgi:hypothetical protein
LSGSVGANAFAWVTEPPIPVKADTHFNRKRGQGRAFLDEAGKKVRSGLARRLDYGPRNKSKWGNLRILPRGVKSADLTGR